MDPEKVRNLLDRTSEAFRKGDVVAFNGLLNALYYETQQSTTMTLVPRWTDEAAKELRDNLTRLNMAWMRNDDTAFNSLMQRIERLATQEDKHIYVTPSHGPNIPEVQPEHNDNPAVWDLVMEDIKKYGTRLQPFNGRDPLWDAYKEALGLLVYLRQAIFEKENE